MRKAREFHAILQSQRPERSSLLNIHDSCGSRFLAVADLSFSILSIYKGTFANYIGGVGNVAFTKGMFRVEQGIIYPRNEKKKKYPCLLAFHPILCFSLVTSFSFFADTVAFRKLLIISGLSFFSSLCLLCLSLPTTFESLFLFNLAVCSFSVVQSTFPDRIIRTFNSRVDGDSLFDVNKGNVIWKESMTGQFRTIRMDEYVESVFS